MRVSSFLVFVPHAIAQTTRQYEAFQAAPGDLIPRFFIDRSFPLAKRAGDCGKDHHNCLDIGFTDDCCDNDSYCYVPAAPVTLHAGRPSTFAPAPSQRAGLLRRKKAAAIANVPKRASISVPPASEGIAAVTTLSVAQAVTVPLQDPPHEQIYWNLYLKGARHLNTDAPMVRAVAIMTKTALNGVTIVEDDDSSGGLSDGAKAGIGVGVVVGASIIVGGLTWLFLKRRRQQSAAGPSGSGEGDGDGSVPARETMTEVSGTNARRGLTQDYFGPDPAAGPYTEQVSSRVTSPGRESAVPMHAQSPGDIAAPVEIDSTAREGSDLLSPMSSPSLYQTPLSETINGRFELYGNETPVTPDRPLSIVPTPPQSVMGDNAPRREQ
ncbi:hypothetical protein FSARC_10992 [Fusarium sarcochroum]|uniref:Uncharacterized protein n=1 Tax=Fusarium sarcochroum TaxID=1208366 RepID=A0A8H4TID4_9HYPO|nr:hypothetical protein FSARC_10992 [Fusarium sarcochroum]